LEFPTIGIVSMGDMGHAVGRTLRTGGHRVLTALDGRSARTQALAEAAGVENVGSLWALVTQADLVLSILPPAAATDFAESIAAQMQATNSRPVFVDCNAIAPATARSIGDIISAADATFIDGGIIGAPPGRSAPTRIYLSGPDATQLESLARPDMLIRTVSAEIGAASGLKMFYAALTKGTMTLDTLVLLGARQMGLSAPLLQEFSDSQPAALKRMEASVPWLAADAERWVGEMEEIAKTFSDVGLTSAMHQGASAVFQLLAASALSSETRETADRTRSLEDAIEAFALRLSESGPASGDPTA